MSQAQRRVGRHEGARVGVFGGTFDPPHVAHLMVAQVAKEQLDLQLVMFVPAGMPPHKSDSVTASSDDRLGMTRAAIQGFPEFAVDDREVLRPGPSYTVDTIAQMQDQCPTAELVLLVGADMLRTLPSWERAQELCARVQIAVAPRPGIETGRVIAEIDGVMPASRVTPVEMPDLDISSTWLRERLRRGLRVDPLLPPPVWDYIRDRGIYYG